MEKVSLNSTIPEYYSLGNDPVDIVHAHDVLISGDFLFLTSHRVALETNPWEQPTTVQDDQFDVAVNLMVSNDVVGHVPSGIDWPEPAGPYGTQDTVWSDWNQDWLSARLIHDTGRVRVAMNILTQFAKGMDDTTDIISAGQLDLNAFSQWPATTIRLGENIAFFPTLSDLMSVERTRDIQQLHPTLDPHPLPDALGGALSQDLQPSIQLE